MFGTIPYYALGALKFNFFLNWLWGVLSSCLYACFRLGYRLWIYLICPAGLEKGVRIGPNRVKKKKKNYSPHLFPKKDNGGGGVAPRANQGISLMLRKIVC